MFEKVVVKLSIIKKIVQLFLVIVGVSLTTQCGNVDKIDLVKAENDREFTIVFKDKDLAIFKDSMQASNANRRVDSEILNRINWNKVFKVYNQMTRQTTYTMPLIINTPNQFDNFIVVESANEQYAYIMRYKPDVEWLKCKPRRGGFDDYTGKLEIINITGEIEAESEYRNGAPVVEGQLPNGRLASCNTFFEVNWTEVCVEGYGCNISEITWIEYDVCSGGGGGLSGGTGGSGTGEGSGGASGGGGGGAGPTPVGGGNPGTIQFVDISYFLTPVFENEDLSSPYHGMKAFDTHGVIYTYDATINAWLLPDLVALIENGFDMNFNSGQFLNDFDGSILSTMVVVALVEPTFIGEIIVGGIIIGIVLYEAYQIANVDIDDSLKDHCADMFYLCTTKYGYKNMDCATCQRFCNV